MKSKLTTGFLLALTSAWHFGVRATPSEQTNTIFVGHSLIGEDMPLILDQLVNHSQELSFHQKTQGFWGASLKYSWENCFSATSEREPNDYFYFACDEILLGTEQGNFDVLITTESNDSLVNNLKYNGTAFYHNQFSQLLHSMNSDARSYLYSSWESLHYYGHSMDWPLATAEEIGAWTQAAAEAEWLQQQQGVNSKVEVIPVSLGLATLVRDIEQQPIMWLDHRFQLFQDEVHLSDVGNLYAALIVYSSLYGEARSFPSEYTVSNYRTFDLPRTFIRRLSRHAWKVVSEFKQCVRLNSVPVAESYGAYLTWQNNYDNIQFTKIYLNDEVVGTTLGSDSSYNLNWLDNQQTYDVRVELYDYTHSLIAASQTVRTTVGDSTSPYHPWNLEAWSEDNIEVKLRWDAATDENGIAYYKIYRNGRFLAHTQSTTYSDLPPFEDNRYQILAVDNYGNESSFSNDIWFTPQRPQLQIKFSGHRSL